MTQTRCYLNAMGILSAAGDSIEATKLSLQSPETCLTMSDQYHHVNAIPLGVYQGQLPEIPFPEKKWHSRNNQFALAVVNQFRTDIDSALEQYGADRIGVVIGTSTSGIAEGEVYARQLIRDGALPADYDYAIQEMGATAQFVAKLLSLKGPCYGISTACSSGAKALASARRLIQAGICDAVIAGGVDTLCHLTVQGFSSLEAVSSKRCNPFSVNRDGINIGEGAGLFLISSKVKGVELKGVGESSDAHHISAPDPSGAGATACMRAALDDAGLEPSEVAYVNLHGTATRLNDQMEAQAIEQVFGNNNNLYCSSTKPFTGHTLGAAGAVEAGICWTICKNPENSILPIHLWDGVLDPELPVLNLVSATSRLDRAAKNVLSNSFAFGGNNISLLLGTIE